jgi:hypothetical protein
MHSWQKRARECEFSSDIPTFRTPSKMTNSAMLDHQAEPNSGVGKRHHRGRPSQVEYQK